MAQTIINVGVTANDGSGDAIRQAGIHINNNFTEVYDFAPVKSDIRFTGNVISTQSSNADIDISASGAGIIQLGAGIQINDNNIKAIRSNDNINIIPNGTGNLNIAGLAISGNNISATRSNDDIRFSPAGTGKVIFGSIKIEGTTLSSDDSSTININDNLLVDGTAVIEGASTLAALVAETTLAVTTAGTTLSSTLSVAGATTLTTTNIDNLTIQDGNISSASNSDINITPGGTGDVVLSSLRVNGTTLDSSDSTKVTIAEAVDVTGALVAKTSISIAGDGATVTGILDEDAMGSDSNVKLATQQSIKAYVDSKFTAMDLDFQGDSGGALSIDLDSETLTFAGTGGITADGATNTMTLNLNTMSGLTTLGMGSLTLAGNDITSSSNADINLTPGGTGTVNMTSLTIDSSIKLFDNKIQCIQSNADMILSANGSGSVAIANIDMNEGTVDNTVIGATTPAAGTFTTLTFSPTNTGTLSTTGITITDNTITTSQSNDNLELNANGSGYVSINAFQFPTADGGTGQVLKTNASKVLSWVTSPVLLGSSDIQDGTATISFALDTVLDHVTSVGSHELISSTTSTLNEFATAKYDSAWYLSVLRDDISDEFEVVKYSVLHGTTADGSTKDAFVTTSGQAKTGTNNHMIVDADISGGNVRLRGTGSSPENSMTFWRIGLGDDDSTGYSSAETDEASIQKTFDATIGSTVVDLDTWGGAANTAAKYFISVKNTSTGEVGSMEALLTHDGSDSYVSVYNEHYSGNHSLLTITADYSGAARMRVSANAGSNTRVNMFRILLADTEGAETKTYTRTVANVTVSSTATVIDTFVDESGSESGYTAAHYIVSGQNGANERFVTEAAVVTDGTNVFITQYGNVSTKGTDMLELTVVHDGSSTVSLKASSTSGGSTTVNCWRVNLSRGEGIDTPVKTLNTFPHATYRSAAYNMQIIDAATGSYELFELRVTHDGTNAYISKFGRVSNTATDLATVTADIDGSDVRIRGSISTTNDHIVKYVRRIIEV